MREGVVTTERQGELGIGWGSVFGLLVLGSVGLGTNVQEKVMYILRCIGIPWEIWLIHATCTLTIRNYKSILSSLVSSQLITRFSFNIQSFFLWSKHL